MQLAVEPLQAVRERRDFLRDPRFWAAFAAGLAWTLWLWARAAPLSAALDDEIGHFLIARDVWAHPDLLLNFWGRFGTTLAFLLPALGGLQVARAGALVMSCASVLLAAEAARLIGVRRLWLIPLLLWFQPWFHEYGDTVLTEVPFMLTLIAACAAALGGRRMAASALFGLLPLMRHEGIALLALWALVLLWRRDTRAFAVAVAPLLVYHAIVAVVFWQAPFAIYFAFTPTRAYGHGGWLHYALPLARSIGPPVTLLAAAGLVLARRDRLLLALAAPYALLVVVEVVIFRFGLFAGAGYGIFLLPVAPFAAVAAAVGVERSQALGADLLARRRFVAAVPAVLAAVIVLATVGNALRSRPLTADGAGAPMRQAVAFLDARHIDPARVAATHVWYFALSGAPVPGGGLQSPWSHPARPRRQPDGAVDVWDCFYSNSFGLKWRWLRAAGFHELARFGGGRVAVLRRAPGGRPLGRPAVCNTSK